MNALSPQVRHGLFLTACVSPETHTGYLFIAVRLSISLWGQTSSVGEGVENSKPLMHWEDLEFILRGPENHGELWNRGSDKAQSSSALHLSPLQVTSHSITASGTNAFHGPISSHDTVRLRSYGWESGVKSRYLEADQIPDLFGVCARHRKVPLAH